MSHIVTPPSSMKSSQSTPLQNSTWNTPPFGSNLNDSKTHYQSGYLLSATPGQLGTSSNSRFDEAPLIQVKAKVNPAFSRNTPDFGAESIFDSSRRRRDDLDDENGPPTQSLSDMVQDGFTYQPTSRPWPRVNATVPRGSSRANPVFSAAEAQMLYVTVFGYPSNRLSLTTAYFKSLGVGGTTEAEPISGVENAFQIGFEQPMEAMRAWRKNGEVIQGEGGRWMVGTKWTDRALAERLLGSVARPANFGQQEEEFEVEGGVSVRETEVIGTPLRLAPSTSAFRTGGKSVVGGGDVSMEAGTPTKGMLGQVSDLIFGW